MASCNHRTTLDLPKIHLHKDLKCIKVISKIKHKINMKVFLGDYTCASTAQPSKQCCVDNTPREHVTRAILREKKIFEKFVQSDFSSVKFRIKTFCDSVWFSWK